MERNSLALTATTRRNKAMGKRIGKWLGLLALSPLLLLLAVYVPLHLAGESLYRLLVRFVVELVWGLRGRRLLLIYSRSPVWHDYIESNWLPILGEHAVVLDWSDRSTRQFRRAFAARVFRAWAGDQNYCPMAIVFPRFGRTRQIGFFYAFRDWKHGKTASLEKAETELLAFVDDLRERSG